MLLVGSWLVVGYLLAGIMIHDVMLARSHNRLSHIEKIVVLLVLIMGPIMGVAVLVSMCTLGDKYHGWREPLTYMLN